MSTPAPAASSVTAPKPGVVLATARAYLSFGWCVVPVGFMQKKPSGGNEWQKHALDINEENVERHFGQRASNLGVLLGTPSGHLADVDLDCMEAVELAPLFLPSTWTFGRASKPRSHWLYVADGATSVRFAGTKGADGRVPTLLELRADKTTGLESAGQTVFPPSVHVSGEPIEWTDDNDAQEAPRVIDAGDLRERVAHLAAACLVMRAVGKDATLGWVKHKRECPPLPAEVAEMVRGWMGYAVTKLQPAARQVQRTAAETAVLVDAVANYNRINKRDFSTHMSECPVCRSPDGFKAQPNAAGRWVCFSSRHPDTGVGRAHEDKNGCTFWTGDCLDIDAHAAGVNRIKHLREEGYLLKGPVKKHG